MLLKPMVVNENYCSSERDNLILKEPPEKPISRSENKSCKNTFSSDVNTDILNTILQVYLFSVTTGIMEYIFFDS